MKKPHLISREDLLSAVLLIKILTYQNDSQDMSLFFQYHRLRETVTCESYTIRKKKEVHFLPLYL